jgi:hypothetical protein
MARALSDAGFNAAAGDLVVTEGVQSLRPGAEVRIVAPQASLAPAGAPARL